MTALLLAVAAALGLPAAARAQSYEGLHTSAGIYDGNWSGTTDQGKTISFTIVNNAVSVFSIGYLTSVGPCQQNSSVTYTYNPPQPFTGSSFSINEIHAPGLSVGVAGIFDSSTSAYGAASFVFTDLGGCISDGSASWTATNQAANPTPTPTRTSPPATATPTPTRTSPSATATPTPTRTPTPPASPPGSFTLTGSNFPAGCPPIVLLSWTASSGAASYVVYRNGTAYSGTLPSSQLSYEDINPTPGQTYTYFIRATNTAGGTNSNTTTITVPCGCNLTCSATVPSTSSAGAAVAFQATATPSGCTGAPKYDWDFGDGSAHSSQQSLSHTYSTAGTYNWRMTATVGDVSCEKRGVITVSAAPSAPQPPVLFIHGFCSDARMWDSMIPALQAMNPRYGTERVDLYFNGEEVTTLAGGPVMPAPMQVYTITFYNSDKAEFFKEDGFAKEAVDQLLIQEEAHQLGQVVAKIMTVRGIAKVDLVAHSMGGLVSRAYIEGLAYHGTGANEPFPDSVRRLVTIDTPHAGTPEAEWILPFSACRVESSVQKAQMTPGGSFLDLLNMQHIPATVSMLTAIASTYPLIFWDEVVEFSSQDITELPQYSCATTQNVEAVENLVLVPCGPFLHTCVTDLPRTALLVNSRIGDANSAVRRCGRQPRIVQPRP